ncbi:MAG: alpha/beta hydrolase [Planktomarina sp.]
MQKILSRFPICLALLWFLASPLTAADFRLSGENLVVSGVLGSRTPGRFERIMADNPQITRLVLGYIEGSEDDQAMSKMLLRVRALGLETYLLADSEIYSGGVDLFVAGKTRRMEAGAIIGVHSWSDGRRDASDFPRTSHEHDMMRGYVAEMLGSEDWYWFTIYAAPADGMHVMTDAEIEEYGLLTSPVINK